MNDTQQAARELLAVAFEENGQEASAKAIREKDHSAAMFMTPTAVALRAITAALSQRSDAGKEEVARVSVVRRSPELIAEFNAAIDAGTAAVDPRDDNNHPLHDIVCGWCGKIHIDTSVDGADREIAITRIARALATRHGLGTHMPDEKLAAWRKDAETALDAILALGAISQPAFAAEDRTAVEIAAIRQNGAMREELTNIGNAISDLARAMRVDQANPDGSWPDILGRIRRLHDAALATPAISPDTKEGGKFSFGHCKDCPGTHSLLCCKRSEPGEGIPAVDSELAGQAEKIADAVADALASVSVAYTHLTLADMSTAGRSWKVHDAVIGENPFDRNEWLAEFENKQEAREYAASLRRERAYAAVRKALSIPRVETREAEWRPNIGDHVTFIPEMMPREYAEEWRGVEARISGMTADPAFDEGVNVEIATAWPPKNGDRTDGFHIHELRPLPTPPAKDGGEA